VAATLWLTDAARLYSESGAVTPPAYEVSRNERQAGTFSRLLTLNDRGRSAHTRNLTAAQRDGNAAARDEAARLRDARAEVIDRAIAASDAPLSAKLESIRAHASLDRARAAADRERAAKDREAAAAERARIELELHRAHLDDLTGAFRREMGGVALEHEVARARRYDQCFVLAFVDVDGMKIVNDRDGHAAGDRVLQVVVNTIRSKLRSFDPVVRYGGDEFVCGLGGTGLKEAQRRFAAIARAVTAGGGVGISVGLAELAEGETSGQLTARADAQLLAAKKRHLH
jgi:diguanylate cyclase (GGDEF)-like protein